MKGRLAYAIIALMGLVIAALSWALVYYSRDELGTQTEKRDDRVTSASVAGIESGRAIVRLSAQSQAAAGIVVQPLKSATHESALEAYGIVANLQPLAEWRGRYLSAAAEARAARATLAAAESEYRRMQLLFQDDRNVSEQAMQAALARYRAEQLRVSAADQAAASIRDGLRGAWGESVTQWAVNPDSQTMRSLLQQTSFLVQLVVPNQLPRGALRNRIAIAPAIARENVRRATFVGASPQIDAAFPGETYFYIVNGGGLRAGMRVVARFGMGGSATGVIVPSAAVVWHAGKAWAYVKDDDDSFARFEVLTADEMEGGWFNTAGFDDDDEVVVSGAQLLLSEELKYQIRNENED
ncbi:MAG TPA: hypothetical protein VN496_10470 [Burkholderiales bacterium]|nr:hypothetical protein [Burkholderiales bacterium]